MAQTARVTSIESVAKFREALLEFGASAQDALGAVDMQVRRAVDWFMIRSQPNGLLGNPTNAQEGGRYMYGHGFGLLFLSCVYGEEDLILPHDRSTDSCAGDGHLPADIFRARPTHGQAGLGGDAGAARPAPAGPVLGANAAEHAGSNDCQQPRTHPESVHVLRLRFAAEFP